MTRELFNEAFEIYLKNGAEALDVWRKTLDPKDLKKLTQQTAEVAQEIQKVVDALIASEFVKAFEWLRE